MNIDELDRMLAQLMDRMDEVSDVNFTVGRPPLVEVYGDLKPAAGHEFTLTPGQTEALAMCLIQGRESHLADLNSKGSCDLAHRVSPGGQRFRVNIFRAQGTYSIVCRALPSEIPSMESFGLPKILYQIPELKNGLVLVTGATGSGKSTTLAAIINQINQTRAVHAVTLEDPVEFEHPHQMATMNQRELGVDFDCFASGLRAALRQAPKVILVGEMRDRETIEIGLKAAETGHLVLSTLHTIDAGQTINRVVGAFEYEEQRQIRSRLAQTLRFVVGQRLLPRKSRGRVAALEIMGSSLRTRELICNDEGENKTFNQVIADSRAYGWQTFDQHIVDLFAADLITEEVARSYCTDLSVVATQIDRQRAERGEETSDLGELQMERRYESSDPLAALDPGQPRS